MAGVIAHAQDRGASGAAQSPAAQSGAPAASESGGAARSQPNRAAQSQENRGAAQSGHETGQGRAEERRPEPRQGAAEGERNRNQAQEKSAEPNRQGAAEGERNRNQAQEQRGQQNRQGAAEGERNRNQAQEQRGQQNRQGAAEGERNRNQAQEQRGQQNQPAARSSQSERNSAQPSSNSAQQNNPAMQQNQNAQGQRRGPDAAGGNRENERAESRGGSTDVNVTGSITVDRQKASRVHDELIRSGRRENINVSINIGEALPQRVRVRPVPQSIVSISPEFRGYDYVVVRDEIVIVEPRTKKVVTIIRSNDNRGSRAERAAFSLNTSQKSRIRRDIRMDGARNVDVEVHEGRPVPQTVVLESLPDVVIREIPEVRRYRYFVDDRRIILVDPDTREVVDIID
jgi:hypothetical protein